MLKTLTLLIFLAFAVVVDAQDKTIILVRHAEKAAEDTTMTGDPDLSTEGKQRVDRLWKIVKKYKPHEIFATSYKRVRQTVEPIAKRRGKEVQVYDPQKQADLIQQIMASKTEHYLIAGHSNTIPGLANALAKKEIFRQLPDSEYGVIWVIKIRGGLFKRIEVYEY